MGTNVCWYAINPWQREGFNKFKNDPEYELKYDDSRRSYLEKTSRHRHNLVRTTPWGAADPKGDYKGGK